MPQVSVDIEVSGELTEKGRELLKWLEYEDEEMIATFENEIIAYIWVNGRKQPVRWQQKPT